jgi:hypothetical protein
MNRSELERKILLAQSGELAPAEKAELELLLAQSDENMALREELDNLFLQAQNALVSAEPSPGIVSRILSEAREPAGRNRILFTRPAVRLAACAAALALAVTGWFALVPDEEQPDQVSQLQVLVAMVSEEDVQDEAVTGEMEEERVRALARQLLIMEGFGTEEVFSEEALPLDPAPTTLRLRNTTELHPRICV